MSSTADNPYASPESVPERRRNPDTAGTFAGMLGESASFSRSLYKFYIINGQLLAAPLQWPVTGWHWVMQLLPLAMFGGVVMVSWLWSPAAPYLMSGFLGLLVLWLGLMTFLLRTGERRTRVQAALFDKTARNLDSFLAIDGRSFQIRTDEVGSLEVAPRSQWKNSGRVAGSLTFRILPGSEMSTPLRIVVVGPYDMGVIREELVAAGFPVTTLR